MMYGCGFSNVSGMRSDPIDTKRQVSPVIHGHRGFRGLYPENTVAAFIEAVKLRVDALEMDVVISADHQVVVSHEAWMNPLFCSGPDGLPVSGDPASYNL